MTRKSKFIYLLLFLFFAACNNNNIKWSKNKKSRISTFKILCTVLLFPFVKTQCASKPDEHCVPQYTSPVDPDGYQEGFLGIKISNFLDNGAVNPGAVKIFNKNWDEFEATNHEWQLQTGGTGGYTLDQILNMRYNAFKDSFGETKYVAEKNPGYIPLENIPGTTAHFLKNEIYNPTATPYLRNEINNPTFVYSTPTPTISQPSFSPNFNPSPTIIQPSFSPNFNPSPVVNDVRNHYLNLPHVSPLPVTYPSLLPTLTIPPAPSYQVPTTIPSIPSIPTVGVYNNIPINIPAPQKMQSKKPVCGPLLQNEVQKSFNAKIGFYTCCIETTRPIPHSWLHLKTRYLIICGYSGPSLKDILKKKEKNRKKYKDTKDKFTKYKQKVGL